MERALESGDVIPKDPSQVQATPPKLIGAEVRMGGEPIRLALIRQRAEALRASRGTVER
jgi:hypothetical protein